MRHTRPKRSHGQPHAEVLLAVASWLMVLLVGLVALAGRTGFGGALVAIAVLLAGAAALAFSITRWLDRERDENENRR